MLGGSRRVCCLDAARFGLVFLWFEKSHYAFRHRS